MRKILIPFVALFALCGCDNPEDFTHPENPKKEVNLTVTPTATTPTATTTTTTTQTTGGTPTATTTTPDTTTTPPVNSSATDTSPAKTADAPVTGTFDKVNVSAALKVDINVGQPSKVTVDCSKNSFDQIQFEEKDGALNINTSKGFSASTAKIAITMPALVALSAGKSALVKVTNVSGANLAVNVQDASSVEIDGNVENVDVTIANSCLVKMKELTAKSGNLTSSGRSVLEVRCTEKVVATSSGESVITIYGLPRKVTKNKTDKSIINLAP